VAGQVRLSAVLRAAALELQALSKRTEALQAMTSAEASEHAVEGGQDIDYVAQHLDALGAVLDRLAAQAPDSLSVAAEELASTLTLSGLSARLGLTPAAEPGPSGELDLF
jgi:hypothetical protein